MTKRCHRDLQARGKLFGFEPELALTASAAFALLSKLGAGLFLSAVVAGAVAWAMSLQRVGRLRGIMPSIREFLRWPTYQSCHGQDRVPRFPKDTV